MDKDGHSGKQDEPQTFPINLTPEKTSNPKQESNLLEGGKSPSPRMADQLFQ